MEEEKKTNEQELTLYFASKENDKLNILGENGWFIYSQSPVIIAHEFKMPDGEHLIHFKKWLEERANASNDEREFIKKAGYPMRKMKSDGFKGERYVITDFSALFDWRIEFDFGEDKPIVYMTFGPQRMASPAIASKKAIDDFVPKEIMQLAIENGAIYEGKMDAGGYDA